MSETVFEKVTSVSGDGARSEERLRCSQHTRSLRLICHCVGHPDWNVTVLGALLSPMAGSAK